MLYVGGWQNLPAKIGVKIISPSPECTYNWGLLLNLIFPRNFLLQCNYCTRTKLQSWCIQFYSNKDENKKESLNKKEFLASILHIKPYSLCHKNMCKIFNFQPKKWKSVFFQGGVFWATILKENWPFWISKISSLSNCIMIPNILVVFAIVFIKLYILLINKII